MPDFRISFSNSSCRLRRRSSASSCFYPLFNRSGWPPSSASARASQFRKHAPLQAGLEQRLSDIVLDRGYSVLSGLFAALEVRGSSRFFELMRALL